MDVTSKKQIILVGRNHYGRIPMHELATVLARSSQEPRCKICGTKNNLLLNGYCIDCDEELESKAK